MPIIMLNEFDKYFDFNILIKTHTLISPLSLSLPPIYSFTACRVSTVQRQFAYYGCVCMGA